MQANPTPSTPSTSAPSQVPAQAPAQAPAQPPTTFRLVAPVEGASPSNVYRAMVDAQSELSDQLRTLESRRDELMSDLRRDNRADDAGAKARVAEMDARISSLDAQIAVADAGVAQAAAIPGAIVPKPPSPPERTSFGDVLGMSLGFTTVLLFPIVIAYTRRIWRRSGVVVAPLSPEIRTQIDQLSNAVESIGLEVERIGEGQRFITRVLGEPAARTALAQAAGEGMPAARNPTPAYRSGV